MSGVRARILIALMVVIALVGVTGPSWSALPATAQVPVFSEAARQPAGDTRLGDPTIVRARYVDVNLATMDGTPRAGGAPVGRGDVLTLNLFPYQSSLFPEVTVTAVRDRVVPSSTGQGYVWSGYVQGSNASVSPVTITVEGGVMIANVRANGAAYQVRHTPSGVQAIYQLDEQHVPPHDHVYLSYADANRSAAILAASRAQSPAAATKAPAPAAVRDTGTTIDVYLLNKPG